MNPSAAATPFQRTAVRRSTDAAVLCRPHTSYGAFSPVRGILRNFCTRGVYIETDVRFDPGTILFIRSVCLLRSPIPETPEQPRTICLAEVKWIREIANRRRFVFGMGLRYLY
jgi:hypothetical protein